MALDISFRAPCCHPDPPPFQDSAGHGPPTLAADAGDTYIDVDTNNFYVNVDGTPGGWVLQTAGGGATEIFSTVGDPNGVTVGTAPAMAYDKTTMQVWVKTNGGTNNTGWSLLLS